jgi:hypothetical protein
MKVGDIVYDAAIGQTGLVLEIVDTPPEGVPWSVTHSTRLKGEYYVIMYDDGDIEGVFDDEVEIINESR